MKNRRLNASLVRTGRHTAGACIDGYRRSHQGIRHETTAHRTLRRPLGYQNKRSSPQLRDTYLSGLGNVFPSATVSVKSRIEGRLMAVSFNEGDRVQAGQLLASIDSRAFQIQLEQLRPNCLQINPTSPGREAHRRTPPQLEAKIAADQATVNTIRLQLAYSEIHSPITGIAGLRLIEPGNIVRPSDNAPIVVITQLQPVAVLFTIQKT